MGNFVSDLSDQPFDAAPSQPWPNYVIVGERNSFPLGSAVIHRKLNSDLPVARATRAAEDALAW